MRSGTRWERCETPHCAEMACRFSWYSPEQHSVRCCRSPCLTSHYRIPGSYRAYHTSPRGWASGGRPGGRSLPSARVLPAAVAEFRQVISEGKGRRTSGATGILPLRFGREGDGPAGLLRKLAAEIDGIRRVHEQGCCGQKADGNSNIIIVL